MTTETTKALADELAELRAWKEIATREGSRFPLHDLAREFGLVMGDDIAEKLPPLLRAMHAELRELRAYKKVRENPNEAECRGFLEAAKEGARIQYRSKGLDWLKQEWDNWRLVYQQKGPMVDIVARLEVLNELIEEKGGGA